MKKYITFIFIILFLFHFKVQDASAISVGADSAILMEQQSGRVLFEQNAHEKSKIASITKIMTAIIAIENEDLNKQLTASKNAVYQEGSSIFLVEGEKIRLEDLLYGLMLRSGNDAATAIAEGIGGSVEGFVFLMNQKAVELGMENTQFSNPSGLDDGDNHYSTAYDMALLTRYAMENDVYRKISGTKQHRFKRGEQTQVWGNKNRLLTEKYKHATGGKTGFTKKSGRTLVTTAEKNKLEMISVTLDSHNDWTEHIQMYEYGSNNFKEYEMIPKGEINALTEGNKQYYLKTASSYPLKKTETKNIRIEYQMIEDTKKIKNNRAGMAIVFLNDEPIIKQMIYLKEEEKAKENWWQTLKNKLFSAVYDG